MRESVAWRHSKPDRETYKRHLNNGGRGRGLRTLQRNEEETVRRVRENDRKTVMEGKVGACG